MSSDPFPNTADRTMEQRLYALFNSQTCLVVSADPVERKEGFLWFNTTDRTLKLFAQGKVWGIGQLSVLS